VEDKWNEGVLRQVNNQTPVVELAQEWRCVHTTFEGASIKSEVNSCSCSWSIKEDCIWR
jgi:hypothetical protein